MSLPSLPSEPPEPLECDDTDCSHYPCDDIAQCRAEREADEMEER